jgi:hypothetical protein
MMWKAKSRSEWNIKFALFPRRINGHWVWLEKYATRFAGSHKDIENDCILCEYELDHPVLGRFRRVDRWGPYPMDYFTGEWCQA